MKRNYSNEEFSVEEFQQVSEVLNFRAELYRSSELFLNKNEEHKVDEIKACLPPEKKKVNNAKKHRITILGLDFIFNLLFNK